MHMVYYYEGAIGRYALEDTDGFLTRMWLGDRLSLVPENAEIKETALLREARKQLDAYFEGRLKKFDLPLLPVGTDFQMRVWEMLCCIPYGTTITYGELAEKIGNSKASRAVGLANSQNPLPVFIPCHRVVGAGGKLTGYTGGLNIKEILLKVEKIFMY